jgi:hypothetical protein
MDYTYTSQYPNTLAAPHQLKQAPVCEPDDQLQDQQSIFEAKELLRRCLFRDRRLNSYSLKVLLGYGTFGIVVSAQDSTGSMVRLMRIS